MKLIENMVYKNFTSRLLFSFLFIIIYISIIIYKFDLIFYLILLIYALISIEVFLNFKKFKLLPFVYIFFSCTFFLTIDFNANNYNSFNLFIFIVILFDSSSYLVGKIFGKNKLISISPNKTAEGLIGGILLSFFLSFIFADILGFIIDIRFLSFLILIILCAFVGDIIESYFKRINDLKNSSDLIPGHGGIFDRFDSFLFSIIFYSISVNFL